MYVHVHCTCTFECIIGNNPSNTHSHTNTHTNLIHHKLGEEIQGEQLRGVCVCEQTSLMAQLQHGLKQLLPAVVEIRVYTHVHLSPSPSPSPLPLPLSHLLTCTVY